MNVIVLDGERHRWMAECLTVLLKFKYIFVNIATVVQGNVTVNRFRSPDLGGNVDHKVVGGRQRRRRCVVQDVGIKPSRRKEWRRAIVGSNGWQGSG